MTSGTGPGTGPGPGPGPEASGGSTPGPDPVPLGRPHPEGPPAGRSPTLGRLLWRGMTRRCPACGAGRLFRRWVTMVELCPRCGLRFARIEGHWIGAIGINTVVSFGALLVATVVGLVSTFPEFPIAVLMGVNAAVAVVVPLTFYPFSRTLWTALDIAMRPLEPHEVDWSEAG